MYPVPHQQFFPLGRESRMRPNLLPHVLLVIFAAGTVTVNAQGN